LTLAHVVVVCDRERRQAGELDLQQRQVELARNADDAGLDGPRRRGDQGPQERLAGSDGRHDDLHPAGPRHDVGIGEDEAVRVDDDAGTDAALPADDKGLM